VSQDCALEVFVIRLPLWLPWYLLLETSHSTCVDHVSGEYKMSRTEHMRGQKVQAEGSQGYNEYILSRSAEHVRYGELEP